jgi:hypothetical protein
MGVTAMQERTTVHRVANSLFILCDFARCWEVPLSEPGSFSFFRRRSHQNYDYSEQVDS